MQQNKPDFNRVALDFKQLKDSLQVAAELFKRGDRKVAEKSVDLAYALVTSLEKNIAIRESQIDQALRARAEDLLNLRVRSSGYKDSMHLLAIQRKELELEVDLLWEEIDEDEEQIKGLTHEASALINLVVLIIDAFQSKIESNRTEYDASVVQLGLQIEQLVSNSNSRLIQVTELCEMQGELLKKAHDSETNYLQECFQRKHRQEQMYRRWDEEDVQFERRLGDQRVTP